VAENLEAELFVGDPSTSDVPMKHLIARARTRTSVASGQVAAIDEARRGFSAWFLVENKDSFRSGIGREKLRVTVS
jgi:hypothetical protein